LKICHVITTLELGGAETLLANFCNIHIQHNDIYVIYLKGEPRVLQMFDLRIRIKYIPLGLSCISQIESFFKEWQPDIIHTHLGHADLISFWAAKKLKSKLFCTMHNIHFKWDWRDQFIFSIYKWFFKTFAKNCQIVCISKVVQNHVQNRLGVSPERTHLVYNAIPELHNAIIKQESRNLLNINSDKFIVLFVGRLEKQKSVHVLVNAVVFLKNNIHNLQVEIVGVGSLTEELKYLTEQLGLNDIIKFRGNTIQPELYYTAADVFVLPSLFEGLGIVLLEAFRASLPIIASAVDGPKELIQNGENGLLFESGNYFNLANCILKLYQSVQLRDKLGSNGHKSFQGKFNIIQYAETLERLYVNA